MGSVLCVCVYRSDYRKSKVGQITSICPKIAEFSCSFLDIFSGVEINRFCVCLTSMLKMRAVMCVD